VISIGNLTLGGTGKTPLVVYLAQWLVEHGFTPALLSRGYGSQAGGRITVVGPADPAPLPATCGDEPALIRRQVPHIWLGVCARRDLAAGEILKRCRQPVFLLDDGYQHRRLCRDLNLVVIDATQPFMTNRVVPLGTLREPPSALQRAGAVFINGDSRDVETDVRRLAPGACVFRCLQSIQSIIALSDWLGPGRECAPPPAPASVFLMAAIGNPERFQADAQRF
jgi:tetraacyldisaccharide 4'-kinase